MGAAPALEIFLQKEKKDGWRQLAGSIDASGQNSFAV